jgi:hypothetical protein
MRAAKTVAAIVFALFTALQVNDPDAPLWIALYGYALGVSLLAVFDRTGYWPLPGLLVYGVGFARLAPTVGGDWWYVEEAREALGLLLGFLWMGVLLFTRFAGDRFAQVRG